MNKTGETYVYFVIADEVQRLKIGLAYNVEERLKQLKSMSPITLTVLRVVRLENVYQARKTERMFHNFFEAKRHHGEWFNLDQEIRDCVESEVQKLEEKQKTYDDFEYRVLSSPLDVEESKVVVVEK